MMKSRIWVIKDFYKSSILEIGIQSLLSMVTGRDSPMKLCFILIFCTVKVVHMELFREASVCIIHAAQKQTMRCMRIVWLPADGWWKYLTASYITCNLICTQKIHNSAPFVILGFWVDIMSRKYAPFLLCVTVCWWCPQNKAVICIFGSPERDHKICTDGVLKVFKVGYRIELTKDKNTIHATLSSEQTAKWRRVPVVAQVCTAVLFLIMPHIQVSAFRSLRTSAPVSHGT